ncbi:MAG: alanine dehydrogenase [Gammaproteobacteria bacterium]|nr:alanine dehydrogenase [Gammaproteobacteria bacterium]
MLIGVPTEIKQDEHRVGLTPTSVRELTHHGHQVLVQSKAGAGIGVRDMDYERAGATIVPSAREVFAKAEMVVKVKEPQAPELAMLRPDQVLFTYLHLAPDPRQTEGLIRSGAIAIAYETVTGPNHSLPLLSPMSEVAGRMAVQAGAHCLEREAGGAGILLGGVPGVKAANVVVLGGGVVGTNAIRVAMGMEAQVTVIDRSLPRLKELDFQFGGRLNTIYSTVEAIEHYVAEADLVIGAVLVPGAAAPRLVSRAMVREMRDRSVVVDVAIDQGGCFETARPTTHSQPTYVEEGVVHYCVANMPGAVARTSTFALNNATLPYVLALADKGYRAALLDDPGLLDGLNVHRGKVTCEAVASALECAYLPARDALQ